MQKKDTKQRILDKALDLFSKEGYDAVSVGQIAAAVGIKAPSIYNHFPSKQAIFDAIVEATAAQYTRETGQIAIHVQDVAQDIPFFGEITEEMLIEKVRQIFLYSLHAENICRFRRMMTIEQFRSPKLAALYSKRYVDRIVAYHAEIFRNLIAAGKLYPEDPQTLALIYIAPVMVLLDVCDRQPEREEECLAKLEAQVRLFYRTYTAEAAAGKHEVWAQGDGAAAFGGRRKGEEIDETAILADDGADPNDGDAARRMPGHL